MRSGIVVKIHSLQSPMGKKLNGLRGIIIREVPNEDRYEILLESDTIDGTKSIKPTNLNIIQPLSLPSPYDKNSTRGQVTKKSDEMSRKLCELLLWYRDNYRPSETLFTGFAAMAFMRMGQENFKYFTKCQIEQLGATLALAAWCEEKGAADGNLKLGTKEVLFALLEGDCMYIEVLVQQCYWTGYICPPSDENNDDKSKGFNECLPDQLTPDQHEEIYIECMELGPIQLILNMMKYRSIRSAFFVGALRHCRFYHLFVQRLLRWIARETKQTSDGIALGKHARYIVEKGLFYDPNNNSSDNEEEKKEEVTTSSIAIPTSEKANYILQNVSSILTSPSTVTKETVLGLLR